MLTRNSELESGQGLLTKKNEKWKMKNEKWKMKNEKWKMKNEKIIQKKRLNSLNSL